MILKPAKPKTSAIFYYENYNDLDTYTLGTEFKKLQILPFHFTLTPIYFPM